MTRSRSAIATAPAWRPGRASSRQITRTLSRRAPPLDPQLTERQRAAKYGDRQDRVWLDGEYVLFAQHYPHIKAYWDRREARRLLKSQREARRLERERRSRPVLVVVND